MASPLRGETGTVERVERCWRAATVTQGPDEAALAVRMDVVDRSEEAGCTWRSFTGCGSGMRVPRIVHPGGGPRRGPTRTTTPSTAWAGGCAGPCLANLVPTSPRDRVRSGARWTIPGSRTLLARCIAERKSGGRPADIDAAVGAELHRVAALELVGLPHPAEVHRSRRHRGQEFRCNRRRSPSVGPCPWLSCRRTRSAARLAWLAAACPRRPPPRAIRARPVGRSPLCPRAARVSMAALWRHSVVGEPSGRGSRRRRSRRSQHRGSWPGGRRDPARPGRSGPGRAR